MFSSNPDQVGGGFLTPLSLVKRILPLEENKATPAGFEPATFRFVDSPLVRLCLSWGRGDSNPIVSSYSFNRLGGGGDTAPWWTVFTAKSRHTISSSVLNRVRHPVTTCEPRVESLKGSVEIVVSLSNPAAPSARSVGPGLSSMPPKKKPLPATPKNTAESGAKQGALQ